MTEVITIHQILPFAQPERESIHNTRVRIPVSGGILTFEQSEVPGDILVHPEKYELHETQTGKKDSPWKNAKYEFKLKEPETKSS